MNSHLKSLLKKLPNKPGIYKFKDANGLIIYVGKAKELNKRVRSYFRKQKNTPLRTQKLVEKIEDVEWIIVDSEWEALVLETNLIKEFRPKYNVMMKDDKNYVYVKLTKNEVFPRIKIVRKVEKDGARYFGPKTSAHQVKKTLTLLQKLFMYRSCDLGISWDEKTHAKVTKKTIAFPCLDYHIKRCAAPCISKITPEDYAKSIEQIELFLEGKTAQIEEQLMNGITQLVADKKFEKAAALRDKLLSVQSLKKKQLVTSADKKNVDIIGFVLDRGRAYFNLFVMRDGKLINQENFTLDAIGYEHGDEAQAFMVLESFLFQYYLKATDFPAEILTSIEIEERELFLNWIQEEAKRSLVLKVPKKGKNRKLVELAEKNAESYFKQEQARWNVLSERDGEALNELKDTLKLKKLPKRIECYDISHLSGTDTVASMVVFEDGKAKSSDYRKFRIKSLKNGEVDDYKSMEEVLERRLSKLSTGSKDIKVRKATERMRKKLEKLFEEWTSDVAPKDFELTFLATLNGETTGLIVLEKHKGNIHSIKSLYVEEKNRHKGVATKLLKHSLLKVKSKRFYVHCLKELSDLYLSNGFEEIKSFPESLQKDLQKYKKKQKGEIVLLAFDPVKGYDSSFQSTPDLIVIDGGKGQLKSALKSRDLLGLEKIPIISLAKRFEDVYVPGKSLPVLLAKDSQASYLLQRIRDEAHRFAIGFQKKSRKKHITYSELDEISGVGKTIKMKLLGHFGSLDAVKNATLEELSELTGAKLADRIYRHLKPTSHD